MMKGAKKILFGCLLFGFCWFSYPVIRVTFFYFSDPIVESVYTLNGKEVDDASGVNQTKHRGVISLVADLNKSTQMLREALKRADSEGLKLMPMGARHSMGKQAFVQNAILLDTLKMNGMSMDGDFLRVQAGARWFEVIEFLAQKMMTVEIMQSNSDFSVGGTLSVNAHGWQPGRPPVSSSVEKLSVMKVDGEIVMCSRDVNEELFRHTLGGYGLFGIILEAWILPVPNKVLRSMSKEIKADEFASVWDEITVTGAELAYGRLSVSPGSFFETVWLSTFWPEGEEVARNPKSYEIDRKARLSRAIFRASLGSNRGKSFRHWMERSFGGELSGTSARSRLLSEPAKVFGNHDPQKRDVLLEFFIPKARFGSYVRQAASIISDQYENLLNVTVREIAKDIDTALPYARQDMFGLVMLFTVDKEESAEFGLSIMASKLIELAHEMDGSFYLPYRNFADPEQVKKCYPNFSAFLIKKKEFDPKEILFSGFYNKYR
jgi:FAD/FMN-containing dehydrogenase